MKDILAHPLGPLIWALSTLDGLPRKTNKAALAKLLQNNVALAEELPTNTASVVDGMNLVRKIPLHIQRRFHQDYIEDSINNSERSL